MDQIDESKRKPRRTKGTPSYYYRNRVAAAGILAGTALFALWYTTPIFQAFNKRVLYELTITEEEKDRKFIFSLTGAPRTSAAIKETIEERDKLATER